MRLAFIFVTILTVITSSSAFAQLTPSEQNEFDACEPLLREAGRMRCRPHHMQIYHGGIFHLISQGVLLAVNHAIATALALCIAQH